MNFGTFLQFDKPLNTQFRAGPHNDTGHRVAGRAVLAPAKIPDLYVRGLSPSPHP